MALFAIWRRSRLVALLLAVTGHAGRPRRSRCTRRSTGSSRRALLVPPAPSAGDAEFLRRVSLDLTDRIATADEVRAFLHDTSPDKRRH